MPPTPQASTDSHSDAKNTQPSTSAMGLPTSENLLLAVPKKGRLHDKVVKILVGAGIEYYRPARVDIAQCTNLPITLVFLPASDIVTYVGDGNVHAGITGQDIVAESDSTVVELMALGFGKCDLAVQAPVNDCISSPSQLAGKRIVTSFPAIAARYFKQFEKDGVAPTKIKFVSGSVEAACSLGLADGVVDLVETGTTMRAAGLELVATIMQSEAVLIANPLMQNNKLVCKIHQRFLGYITATKYKVVTYNIGRELLKQAMMVTPGRRSPTVNVLTTGDYAVNAMVERCDVSEIMDQLHEIGATDILLLDIENCRV